MCEGCSRIKYANEIRKLRTEKDTYKKRLHKIYMIIDLKFAICNSIMFDNVCERSFRSWSLNFIF